MCVYVCEYCVYVVLCIRWILAAGRPSGTGCHGGQRPLQASPAAPSKMAASQRCVTRRSRARWALAAPSAGSGGITGARRRRSGRWPQQKAGKSAVSIGPWREEERPRLEALARLFGATGSWFNDMYDRQMTVAGGLI